MHQFATLRIFERFAATFVYSVTLAIALAAPQLASGDTLDGVWDITMIVADGRVLDPAAIRQSYSADGRLTVQGQTASLVMPGSLQTRQMPLRIDASQAPATVDVALSATAGGRGVVMVAGSTAMICIASQDKPRAMEFSALSGSGNLLISLKRVATGAGAAPAPAPLAGVPPMTNLADDQLRAMLTGTWGHQDKDTTQMLTFNSDGTMSAVVTWKDQFKRIFHSDVRSSGTWKVENGVVLVQITASTDKNIRGQVYSYRIRSINDKELLAVDQNGRVRQEWRAPGP